MTEHRVVTVCLCVWLSNIPDQMVARGGTGGGYSGGGHYHVLCWRLSEWERGFHYAVARWEREREREREREWEWESEYKNANVFFSENTQSQVEECLLGCDNLSVFLIRQYCLSFFSLFLSHITSVHLKGDCKLCFIWWDGISSAVQWGWEYMCTV